jgi:replicative DNA helicase
MEARIPVLLFSLEMSHAEITSRLLCAEARVDATRIRNGKLHESDWGKISHAIGRLGDAPIYIDDNPNITIMDIRAKARRLKSKLEGGLGLIVIDYLQLMTGRSNAENRQVEVSEISRGLKILARELEVPVVALSQLSRNLEMRADKRPVLADLRESGSLEQDADVVMFLYRDEIYSESTADKGVAEVIVSKHRSGPTGSIRLAFLPQYTRFANMARGV